MMADLEDELLGASREIMEGTKKRSAVKVSKTTTYLDIVWLSSVREMSASCLTGRGEMQLGHLYGKLDSRRYPETQRICGESQVWPQRGFARVSSDL